MAWIQLAFGFSTPQPARRQKSAWNPSPPCAESCPFLPFVLGGLHQPADTWLEEMRNRDSEPLAPSTIATWAYALEKWINVNIGDLPLESANNLAMRELVAKMVKGGLSPKSVVNYAQILKMVIASVTDEQGEQLYPRKWNNKLIRMPKINKKKQRTPKFLKRSGHSGVEGYDCDRCIRHTIR